MDKQEAKKAVRYLQEFIEKYRDLAGISNDTQIYVRFRDVIEYQDVGERMGEIYDYIEDTSDNKLVEKIMLIDDVGFKTFISRIPFLVKFETTDDTDYSTLTGDFINQVFECSRLLEKAKEDFKCLILENNIVEKAVVKNDKYDVSKQELCLLQLIDEVFNVQIASAESNRYSEEVQTIVDKVDAQIALHKYSVGTIEYIDYLATNLPNHPKLNIYGRGSKFLDRSVVGNFYFGLDRLKAKILTIDSEKRVITPNEIKANLTPIDLPRELATDRARLYFSRAVDGGLLTPNKYQPTNNATKGRLAIFANELGKKLNIGDFNAKCERLWGIKYLAQAYQKIVSQKNFDELELEIKQYFITEE